MEFKLAKGCSGQLEVFYNNTWGNVCYNKVDTRTASLICQHLSCGQSGTVQNTWSRLEGAPHWIDELQCRPHDSTLYQCPSAPWGENKCEYVEVAEITCEGKAIIIIIISFIFPIYLIFFLWIFFCFWYYTYCTLGVYTKIKFQYLPQF